MIASYIDSEQREQDVHLNLLTFTYRCCKHPATKLSPNLLMPGREAIMPTELQTGSSPPEHNPKCYCDYACKLKEKSLALHALARRHLKTATECRRRQKDHDTRISERRYQMGDLVCWKNIGKTVGRSPKLEPNKWLGPCVVLKRRSDLSYVVKRGPQGKRRTVHHDNLKPCYLQDVPEWILELQKQLGSAPTTNPATSKLKDPDTGSQTPGDKGLIATPAIAVDKANGDRSSVSFMPQHDFAARHSTRRRRPPHRYMPQ